MAGSKRIPTEAAESLTHQPFSGLSIEGLPAGDPLPTEAKDEVSPSKRSKPNKNRGRVDIIRQTAHRGGKTVTVVSGFVGIGQPEKEELAKRMQRSCGVGGTVKEGRIEIQGDKRDQVAAILEEAGFRPVFAGG